MYKDEERRSWYPEVERTSAFIDQKELPVNYNHQNCASIT